MAAAYVIGFLEGTGAHAYFLATGGLHTFSYAPLPVQLLLHALLLLDPLVALLIVRARPNGALLAAAVMLLDLAANWDGAWHAVLADPVAYLRPVGLLPITVFGIFVVLTALPLRQGLANVEAPGDGIRHRPGAPDASVG
ncbi:hypothetical protein [Streptomyces longisporus]|uniref:Uncharacterized protein n=1 Tax=Streptomyces longisporus TaxID=1948 RepID=A0ABN3ML96_STRLO